jgi:cysteine desulfurase
MPDRVYLDHAATTPLDPRVLEAMLPVLGGAWGNPSSVYREAQTARAHLDRARAKVAGLLGCSPGEVLFTSGGTEADNLAVRGVAQASVARGRHVVTTQVEHHAVLHATEQLERAGFEVTYLPVHSDGLVDTRELATAVRVDTTLVSVMYANNEVGAVQPIRKLVAAASAANPAVRFHTDAVQAAGWLDVGVVGLGVDLLSLSAHKFGGPKGVGALYARRGTSLTPQNVGGGQEERRRAGTEDVAGAVGLATALEQAVAEREARTAGARAVAARLVEGLRHIPGCRLTGPADHEKRLPGLVSCCFEGLEAQDLLIRLDLLGFAASSGSACTTGSLEPSHVLIAMGIDERTARGSLRLSAGPDTSLEDVDWLLAVLPREVERLRGVSVAG